MKHVLVVDDERDILTCLDEALTGEGYRVSAALSGAEALDVLATDVPDLIILDLRMPNMSGLELLQIIRRKHARLPIIICSALSKYRNDYDIIRANVSAFVDKPIDLDKLLATVRVLVADDRAAEAALPPERPREQPEPR